jgi:hypothetical protein
MGIQDESAGQPSRGKDHRLVNYQQIQYWLKNMMTPDDGMAEDGIEDEDKIFVLRGCSIQPKEKALLSAHTELAVIAINFPTQKMIMFCTLW